MVKLLSRQFIPDAEIESELEWLHSIACERAHVLLQLYDTLSSEDKALLAQSGIRLLNYIPSNTWFASVPCSLGRSESALALVCWFGPILLEDKVSTSLLEGSIGGWALREGDKVAIKIAFFEDIDLSDGQDILLKYDAVIVSVTPLSNKVTAEISKEAILLLAAKDRVRWIDVVPPTPTTDQE